MNKILLMHGANLNRLGQRNPEYYGNLTLQALETLTINQAQKFNVKVAVYQSNHEGDLVDQLQCQSDSCEGIIINPGAFAHYSYALYDALLDTQLPIIEVHLSDINQREIWRAHSVTAPACLKVISGKKEAGYIEAVNFLMEHLKK